MGEPEGLELGKQTPGAARTSVCESIPSVWLNDRRKTRQITDSEEGRLLVVCWRIFTRSPSVIMWSGLLRIYSFWKWQSDRFNREINGCCDHGSSHWVKSMSPRNFPKRRVEIKSVWIADWTAEGCWVTHPASVRELWRTWHRSDSDTVQGSKSIHHLSHRVSWVQGIFNLETEMLVHNSRLRNWGATSKVSRGWDRRQARLNTRFFKRGRQCLTTNRLGEGHRKIESDAFPSNAASGYCSDRIVIGMVLGRS